MKPGAMEDRARQLRAERLEPPFERLKVLHRPKVPSRPGDWLHAHRESGQSVVEYRNAHPVRPEPGRSTLYLQPIGDFSAAQEEVVRKTQDYLERFFGLPVVLRQPLPLSAIPASARRVHPSWGIPQVLTTYILEQVLLPRRPADAVAFLALTAEDLYPDPSWNFVFGQASLRERIGVWSLYRNGDPEESREAFQLCLERTLKTAAHELGHMLGLHHCVAYECLMNGSNHRAEADARPLALCPADLEKLCWNVGCDPVDRFGRLAEFARKNGLDAGYDEHARAVADIRGQYDKAALEVLQRGDVAECSATTTPPHQRPATWCFRSGTESSRTR